MDSHAKVIAIGNQKGGVNKSTVATHVAVGLALRGHTVLLVDLDPTAHASNYLGIPHDYAGAFEVLVGDVKPEEAIVTSAEEDVALPENLHMIIGGKELERLEASLLSARNERKTRRFRLPDPTLCLKMVLKRIEQQYDYIIIDTPPNPGLPTQATYRAAEWILLVTTPEPGGVTGLNKSLDEIEVYQHPEFNPYLKLLGVIFSGVRPHTKLSHRLVSGVTEAFPERVVFGASISHSVAIPSAQDIAQTIFEYQPNHKVAKEYQALITELEERLADAQQLAPQEVTHG